MKLLTMIKFCTLLIFCLGVFMGCKSEKIHSKKENISVDEFSVLAWNIWHGANDPELSEDGRPHVINIIKALNPDIILMVETYGSGKMIADSLGYNFHLIAPENTAPDAKHINLSIISRFPLGERFDFYNHFNIGGIEVFPDDSTKLHVFTAWMNYQPWVDDPLALKKTPEGLIEWETSGTRKNELDTIIKGLQPFLEGSDKIPLIVGGDFNIWSHLDWQEETMSQHNNLVVDWWTTSTIEENGLIDSYRKIHPDANEYPGITWDQPEIKDEHRIDFIFYKGEKLEAIKSEIRKEPVNNSITINGKSFLYPSDHGLVLTKFKIKN